MSWVVRNSANNSCGARPSRCPAGARGGAVPASRVRGFSLDPHVHRIGKSLAQLLGQTGPVRFSDHQPQVGVSGLGGLQRQFDGVADQGGEPASGGQLHRLDAGRQTRSALHDLAGGGVVTLAEVQLQGRTRIPGGGGARQVLATVEVSQRHVVGRGWEDAGRYGVIEDGVRCPFTAAHQAAHRGEMTHHHVHPITVEAPAQRGGHRPYPVQVALVVLVGVTFQQFGGADGVTLGQPRQHGQTGRYASDVEVD